MSDGIDVTTQPDGFPDEGAATAATLENITKATRKANSALKKYAKTYTELNEQLREMNKNGGIPPIPPKLSSGSGSGSGKPSRSRPAHSSGGSGSKPDNSVGSARFNELAKKLIGDKGSTAMNAVAKMNPKAYATLNKHLGSMSKLAGVGGKSVAGLVAVGTKAIPVIGAVVAVLSAMYAAGKRAYETNMQLNRSLMAMGATSSELTKSTSDAANSAIKAKNSWKIAGDNLASMFEPIYAGFQNLLGWIADGIADLTQGANSKSGFTQGNSLARWYTTALEQGSYKIPESTSLPVISQIATQFGASGMDTQSAANAAIGTYDAAVKIAQKYGVESQAVAQALGDAWLSGSDAAVQYGIVVNDNILAGYMASKGVDIVNTEITDAAKQAYQYQLVMEQAAAGDSQAMKKQITQWQQLGQKIKDANGQLFSYDKVINLNGRDYSTPVIGLGGVDTGGSGGTGSGGVPPVLPGGELSQLQIEPSVNYDPVYEFERYMRDLPEFTVKVPVTNPYPATILDILRQLGLLPPEYRVRVPVTVQELNQVTELQRQLGLLPSEYHVRVPVDVQGFSNLTELHRYIYSLPPIYPVSVPITVSGLEKLREAVQLQRQLQSSRVTVGSQAYSSAMQGSVPVMQSNRSLSGAAVTQPTTNWAYNSSNTAVSQLATRQTTPSTSTTTTEAKTPAYTFSYSDYNKLVQSAFGVNESAVNWAITRAGGYEKFAALSISEKEKYVNGGTTATNVGKGIGAVGAVVAAIPAAAALLSGGSALLANATAPAAVEKSIGWVADSAIKSSGGILSNAWNSVTGGIKGLLGVPGLEVGGVITSEGLFRGGEHERAEAVLPLETSTGQDALANAATQGLQRMGGGAPLQTDVHINVGGMLLTDNIAQWRKLVQDVADELFRQQMQRGGLGYGTN